MKYFEFFQAFYIGEKDGYLKGQYTTCEIPRFFVETVLQTDKSREKLPGDDSSYDKWFQGSSSPRNHWSNLRKEFDEDKVVEVLHDTIDDRNVRGLLVNFGINSPGTEQVNKELLCVAVAQQFKAIIDGKGTGQEILADIYRSGNIKSDFVEYTKKASQRYGVMRLIGGTEVPLEEFFVCNIIGESERVFADKKEITTTYLDNPTLQAIKDIHKTKRGLEHYDNNRTLLIGSGGCGKSLMLQHLFLVAAEEYPQTGELPIFIELRHFKNSDNLFDFIVESVHSRDEKFTSEIAQSLLLTGRIKLLLDGFDEIDPSEVDVFLEQFEKFSEKYEDVQILITSRNNDALSGIHGYTRLYVWPFDTEQSEKLIEKILTYNNDLEAKETVMDYIQHGFLQKDGIFASHPLLLTYVTMNYSQYGRFSSDRVLFYKVTYEALLSGHDDNKKPYDRVFKSVDDAEQFSEVFEQFCAYTYRDGKLSLSNSEFDTYFNMLDKHHKFKNPGKMKVKNFKHDVCSTACIMYEKAYDIFYIDPGFQEYLFTQYYAKSNTDEMKKLSNSLRNVPYGQLESFSGLDMLKGKVEDKFKLFLLKPFLDDIFVKDETQSFLGFLQHCFNGVFIEEIDTLIVDFHRKQMNASGILYPRIENYAKSILVDYVLREIGIEHDYAFTLYADYVGGHTFDYRTGRGIIGQENSVNGNKVLLIDSRPQDVYDFFSEQSKNGEDCGYLIYENRLLIDFGIEAYIEPFAIYDDPDAFMDYAKNVMKHSSETVKVFNKMKSYHRQLKSAYYNSGYR